MLTAAQQDQLRKVLETERARLIRNAERGLELSMNREQDLGRDSIDEATQESTVSTELRLRDREKWLLAKINDALERLDAGTVDQCEDCEEPIGFKRLLARPVTTLCIDCKESRESEESMSAGPRGVLSAGLENVEELGAQTED